MERFRLDTTNHATHSILPTETILSVQDHLTQFSLSEKFIERIKIAFGDRFDPTKLEELRQQWAVGNFEALPEIELRPTAEINGAIGAFSADTNRIYLSQEFIEQNTFSSEAIVDVLLEETGHFVDTQINELDGLGDEGAIFTALVQGKELDELEVQRLKTEDDKVRIALDGQVIQLEQAESDPGFDINFDYTFDTNGFFKDSTHRAALDAAAAIWESIIQDEFEDVPAGTPLVVNNPQTGTNTDIDQKTGRPFVDQKKQTFNLNSAIDDLVIFVGARDLSSQDPTNIETFGLTNGTSYLPPPNPKLKKQLKDRFEGSDFEPWTSSIVFDTLPGGKPDNWYFGFSEKIPTGKVDFISIALHEIGHALGIGFNSLENDTAFTAKIDKETGNFTGKYTAAVFGAQTNKENKFAVDVPLSFEGTLNKPTDIHLYQDLLKDAEDGAKRALMEPKIQSNQRTPLTVIDIALLQDIGYQINQNVLPVLQKGEQDLPKGTSIDSFQNKLETIQKLNIQYFLDPQELDQKLIKGLRECLATLETVSNTVSNKEFPILGKLQNSGLLQLFDDIANRLSQPQLLQPSTLAFRALAANSVENDIRSTLFNILQPVLLDLNQDKEVDAQDVVVHQTGEEITVDLKLGNKISFDSSLASNLGLPGLGFNLTGDAKAGLDLALDLQFGIDKEGQFFFGTQKKDELTLGISGSIPNAKLAGKLGFLNLNATDQGSNITGTLTVDLAEQPDPQDPTKDGRLTLSELRKVDLDPKLFGSAKVNLDLAANLGLDLAANLGGSIKLPSIKSKFELDWNLGNKENPVPLSNTLLGNSPTVKFKDVTLDLGEFITGFAQPVLNRVSSVTDTIGKLVKPISDPLPILGASLIDIAKTATEAGVATGDFDPDTVEFVSQFADIVDLVKSIPKDPKVGLIDLGDFDLSSDIRTTNASSNTTEPNVVREPAPVADQLKQPQANDPQPLLSSGDVGSDSSTLLAAQLVSPNPEASQEVVTFIDKLKNLENKYGIQFPVLNTPTNVFKLLLGQSSIDLFKYTTPKLGFNFEFTKYPPPAGIPIFGPVTLQFGADVTAGAQLVFGFDSTGVQRSGNPLDGFYVGKPESGSNLSLGGGLKADIGARGGIASASVGGGIGLTVNLDISNPTDGNKIRGSTFDSQNPLCLFEPSGVLSAIVFATLELDLGFFSFTKRINFVNENLIDFSPSTGGCDSPIENHLNVKNPEPDAKIREFLREQGVIDRRGTDASDMITVKSRSGDSSNNLRVDGLPPETNNPNNEYDKVKLIILNGGNGVDIITIASSVSSEISTQLYGAEGDDTLTGGAGIDFLSGGQGTDTLDGGSDTNNTAVYADSPKDVGVVVDLASNIATNDGYGTRDTLKNIQNVEGSQGNDRLTAIAALPDDRGSVLDAGDGNDTLKGGTGNDVLLGGLGADFMDGASGIDTTTYINSNASVYINPSDQDVTILSPLNGVSTFLPAHQGKGGEAEGDQIFNVENVHGSIYDDILVSSNSIPQGRVGHVGGFLGNDIIFAGSGKDELDGDQGIDWLSYRLSDSDEGVNVSLKTGGSRPEEFIFPGQPDLSKLGQGGYAEGDQIQTVRIGKDQNDQPFKYSSFENLEGSDRDDILEGNESETKDDVVVILNGNNIIRGLAGKDGLYGLSGNDTLIGGADGDHLDGGSESGLKFGTLQAESDQLQDGGDTASYEDAPSPVSVNLLTKSGSEGDAAGDTFNEIENLLGSAYGDTLIGDDTANDINPGIQNDGIDVVDGGDGTDRLTINYSLTRTTGSLGAVGGLDTGTLTRDNSRILFSNIERLYIVGASKRDELVGGSKGDILLTALGDDRVDGRQGRDVIRTDEGNDEVIDQLVNDQFVKDLENSRIILDGGSGIDMLSVDLSLKKEDIQLIGTDPIQENLNQSLSFSDESNITGFEVFRKIKTGRGNDTVIQLGRQFNNWKFNNVFFTGAGNDIVNPGLGIDVVDGGIDGLDPDGVLQGDDELVINYSSEKTGTGVFADIARTRSGGLNASLGGRFYRNTSATDQTRLDEVTFSNFERFKIQGTDQSDRLIGGDREDVLQGNAGDDELIGNSGNDQISGGDGKDFVIGGLGDDSLNGGEGDDSLIDGDDLFDNELFLYRNGGNDTLSGGDGNDALSSGIGNDQLNGEDGDDHLFGDDGSDTLNGGSGNDTLEGAGLFSSKDEIDTLTGGTGADVFVIGAEFGSFYFDKSSDGGATDYALITDFNPLEGDRIRIRQCHPGGYDLRATPEGLPEGIAIYGYYNDLIAIVQGVSDLGELGFLNPSNRSSYFIAVGDCPN